MATVYAGNCKPFFVRVSFLLVDTVCNKTLVMHTIKQVGVEECKEEERGRGRGTGRGRRKEEGEEEEE